jgi:phage shock protein B
MSDNTTAIFLAFFVVCLPVWIVLHYISKMRGGRKLDARDAKALEELNRTAARMEQRMLMLERILDAEVPNWRQSTDLGARSHETI